MTIHIGIDWSHQKHDVVIANECGAVLSRLTFEHGAAGFVKLDEHRASLGVEAADCLVGIESNNNILLDFLQTHDYRQVYVVPPISRRPVAAEPASTRHIQTRATGSLSPNYYAQIGIVCSSGAQIVC